MDRIMRALVLCALLLGPSGCSLFSGATGDSEKGSAGKASGTVAAAVAMAEVAISGSDTAPDNKPESDECESCYGKGRSGDGLSICRACNGTGKKKKSEQAQTSMMPEVPESLEQLPTQLPEQAQMPLSVEVQWPELPDHVADRLSGAVESRLSSRFDALDVALAGAMANIQCVPPTPPAEVKSVGRPQRYIEAFMMRVGPDGKSACRPCEEWKQNHREQIIADGWTIEENDGLPGMSVPTFRVWVGNVYKDRVGVLSLNLLKQYEAEITGVRKSAQ